MKRGLKQLDSGLGECGLSIVGSFPVEPEDRLQAPYLILIGNAGSAIWPAFQASPEAKDGEPDPLDRWTRRTIGTLSADLGVAAVYPFDGPPYLPFQQWAMRADPAIDYSPLGIAIHPEWGLWWALRAAILWPEPPPFSAPSRPSPCHNCADRPCLSACPVEAFKEDRYDVEKCAAYVIENEACVSAGCQARLACPVGPDFRYQADHAAFHMNAFRRSRL